MKVRTAYGVVAGGVLLVVSACGTEAPIASDAGFHHRQGGDVNAFGRYRQSTTRLERRVSLRAGTQHVQVHMDCIGHGDITVSLFDGQVGVPCGDTSQAGGSAIGLSKDKPLDRPGTTVVDVHAPRGSTWSVSVDAGPGRIDPTQDP